MTRICIKVQVRGKVQGVGFRYHTAHQGLKLSLTGFARNEADGSVTVMACGEKSSLNALLAWLEKGPDTANVASVQSKELEWQHFQGFIIR